MKWWKKIKEGFVKPFPDELKEEEQKTLEVNPIFGGKFIFQGVFHSYSFPMRVGDTVTIKGIKFMVTFMEECNDGRLEYKLEKVKE